MQQKTVSVVNGRFNVEVLEDGSGPDLLFIHGAGGLMWDALLDELAKTHHVVAPRMPGTGGSTGLDYLMDHHDVFYFYFDLMDALGAEKFTVVGHSMGGWFAAELAAMNPERVEKLVLIAPVGLWNDAYPVTDFFALLPNELLETVFHDTNHPAAKAMQEQPTDEDAIKVATVERAKNLSTAARFLWPIPDKGLDMRIHRIKAPTLILWGKSDGLAPPQYAADFQKAIAGSTVVMLDKSGHMPQMEQPEETFKAITDFLK